MLPPSDSEQDRPRHSAAMDKHTMRARTIRLLVGSMGFEGSSGVESIFAVASDETVWYGSWQYVGQGAPKPYEFRWSELPSLPSLPKLEAPMTPPADRDIREQDRTPEPGVQTHGHAITEEGVARLVNVFLTRFQRESHKTLREYMTELSWAVLAHNRFYAMTVQDRTPREAVAERVEVLRDGPFTVELMHEEPDTEYPRGYWVARLSDQEQGNRAVLYTPVAHHETREGALAHLAIATYNALIEDKAPMDRAAHDDTDEQETK